MNPCEMTTLPLILFLVTRGNAHVVTYATDREEAKRQAHQWLGMNPEDYTVSPLTAPGDRIKLNITLNV